MNSNFKIFTLLFLLSGFSLTLAAKPFAPIAKIPEKLEKDPDPSVALLIHSVKAAKVPDSATVGLPAYLHAEVILTNEGSKDILPSIRLLSTDALSKVFTFYKEKLKDWENAEFFGTFTLWKGKKQDSMMGKAPTINITAAQDDDKKLMPGAQTLISIWYKSTK
jgi:hypothetical protein